MIRLDTQNARSFFSDRALTDAAEQAHTAHETLRAGEGAGAGMLGWRRMLRDPNDALLEDLEATAAEIRERADVLVCIGIGGSYLGARAVIQALTPYFASANPVGDDQVTPTEILFAGHHTSGAYLRELLDYLQGKSVYVNVISKSGTTLEPALAFRLVRRWLQDTFEDADRRIVVTTDPSDGALNSLRQERGYRKYEIPRDVGGRFSVLTPVGLLPIAVAGVDVRSLFYGAVSAYERLQDASDNPALDYAALRALMLDDGYTTETLAVFEPRLSGVGAWWQQLFGESEGKEHTGLFPATVQYTTDLHSLGQFMQEGSRVVVETFLMAEDDGGSLTVPQMEANLDQLDYLAGQPMSQVTRKAYEGTVEAHTEGGVPNMTVWLDRIAPDTVGELIYFFEHAVAASGYMLDVNPFNQPGVEAYKKAMFRLLGRPDTA